jgi:hypothetical protein
MLFAFNLFLPFIEGQGLEAALGGVLGDLRVDRVQLEWVPPGALLGELDGDTPRPGEPATGIDAVVWAVRPDGRRICVLVEVKLTESGFSPCGGKSSRNNTRTDVCGSAQTFFAEPQSCYLRRPLRQQRDPRYWELFAGRHGSVRDAFPGADATGACPFAEDQQQPMRQHALALAVEDAGLADEAVLLLLHHDDNPDVPPTWRAYRDLVAEPHRIHSLPAGTFVTGARSRHPEWARYMSERYRLP